MEGEDQNDIESIKDEGRRIMDDAELTGCAGTLFCHPKRIGHKVIILVLMCLLSFGSYFCYDNPGALQDHVKEDMGVTTSKFMSLYSWYSWPNVILCFFGGFLIDRVFGIRLGTVIFSCFVTTGQVIFASGALANKFWVMDLGRFVFGVGGESLAVAQNTYAVSWFKGRALNMVFGLLLSIARIGSTVNFSVMEPLYDKISLTFGEGHKTLGLSLMIASSFCVFSLLAALVLGFFDWRADRILKRKSGETGEVVQLKDAKDFPAPFWLVSIICVTYYVTIFPFVGLGVVFFERKFDFSPKSANFVNSLVYIISAFASPVLGFVVDRTGFNVMWVFIAVLLTTGSHALLAFTFLNPYVAMSLMGLSYSLLASALWPMVALIIPQHQLGTAYGVMQSVQNLGLGVISLVAGLIVDQKGYLVLEVFFLAWLCLSLIAVILLWVVDATRNGTLNLSVSQRSRRMKEIEIAENLEREKLFASGSMADITPHDLLQPRSEFHIRNRYLSRIGMPLPTHFDVTLCGLIHRTGLK